MMSGGANGLLKFDAYELNLETGELRKSGTPLRLPPQPAKVLALLASHPGELITREALQQHLWNGDTNVDFELGLNSCIRRVRAVLRDDGEKPRYIETVPRRGYRFIASVELLSVAPRRRWWLRPALAAVVLAAVLLLALFTSRGGRRAADPVAYKQFRKGQFFFEEFGPERGRSLAYYQDAVARDPGYALAWAGLANAYIAGNSGLPPLPARDRFPKAKSAALRALEIDPRLTAGHTALAHVLWQDWQWDRAEQEFRKAIELSPEDPQALHLFSLFLSSLGRHEEALREARRGVDVDPVSAIVSFSLAHDLWMARRYDDAIAESRRILELHPGTLLAYNVIAHCYARKGMYREAEEAFRKLKPDLPPSASPWIAYVRALEGRTEEAKTIIAEWQRRSGSSPVNFMLSLCYTALGDKDRALGVLEQNFSNHNQLLVWANAMPEFDRLRGEPRFAALLKKVGIAR
jgi:serine/threonine-protein kinase